MSNQTGEPTIYRDGYTRKVFIKGIPRLHGDVTLEIRPMLVDDRDELTTFVQNNPPKKFNPLIRSTLAKYLVAWNAADDQGKSAEITAANIGRVPGLLYDRLYFVLIGRDAGDAMPEATEEDTNDFAARMLGDEGADAKN